MFAFRFIFVIAMALGVSTAFAQTKEPPKASKADVQKLVDEIKGDQAKMQAYCTMQAMEGDYQAAEQKQDQQKLAELDGKLDQITKTLGDNYDRIISSELDDESAALLDNLGSTCK